MTPHFIWKLAEKGLIKDFKTTEAKSLDMASGEKTEKYINEMLSCRQWRVSTCARLVILIISDNESRKEMVDKFVRYFLYVKGRNNIYFAKFVLCELLNIVVLAFNFYVTNVFFSFKWGRYGFEV